MKISIDNLFDSVKDLDNNSVNHLIKAIKGNNLDGFDYLEFKHSLNNLLAIGMDKETAIKSAFVTAATVGLTEDILYNSAAHYQNVLQGEKEKFAKALQKQIDNQVDKREKQIDKLHNKINQISEKISALEQSKKEMLNLIDNAEEEIRESQTIISATQDKFQKAFNAVNQEIQEDINTYKNTLKK